MSAIAPEIIEEIGREAIDTFIDTIIDKDYKSTLLSLLISNNVLTFGSFTLKSKRISPYFFNSSLLHTAPLLRAASAAYASVLSAEPFVTIKNGTVQPKFDIIFGPAYKGIPICASVTNELAVRDRLLQRGTWDNVSYSYNRKEAKDHGEGGIIVGAPLKGKRVVILDDVITAGTALREAVDLILKQGGEIVGVIVLLDREERVKEDSGESAIDNARTMLEGKVPIRSVIGLHDIIDDVNNTGEDNVELLKDYRNKYGAYGN